MSFVENGFAKVVQNQYQQDMDLGKYAKFVILKLKMKIKGDKLKTEVSLFVMILAD